MSTPLQTPPPADDRDPPAGGLEAAPGDVLAPRDVGNWAGRVDRLALGELPAPARNLNVDGRRVASPVQGFGKLWQKTYSVRLEGADVTPEAVVAAWKANFGVFWPRNNWFYSSLEGINPGDVAVLNLRMFGVKMVTGVLVLYADDTSFTVMTPEGHQFAGFNTFSAHRDGDAVVAQIQALVRGSDPLFELGLIVQLAHVMEDRFWRQTLRNLAAYHGVVGAEPAQERVCLDTRRQWRYWRNVWQNALVRSALYALTLPVRALGRRLRRRKTPRVR